MAATVAIEGRDLRVGIDVVGDEIDALSLGGRRAALVLYQHHIPEVAY